MTVAHRWSTSRFGLMFHASLASVPAWAPLGRHAECYQRHLGEPTDGRPGHPTPLVEVLAHHRERWSHVSTYRDFAQLLTFELFDADDWTELAVAAGAGHTIGVAMHHDGLRWWDTPVDNWSVMGTGPRRNVIGDLAAAAERAELGFGTYYSMAHAMGRAGSPADAGAMVLSELSDLVERHGSRILWGDAERGTDTQHPDRPIDRLRAAHADVLVNDRWGSAVSDFVSIDRHVPAVVPQGPWELLRGIGFGLGYSQVEGPEHQLDEMGIIDLLTEVVARGGNLVLAVGIDATGSVPAALRAPLIAAGRWVRRYRSLLETARPWQPDREVVWGDRRVRLVRTADDGDDTVTVFDIGGCGLVPQFDDDHFEVREVHEIRPRDERASTETDAVPCHFDAAPDGLRITRPDRSSTTVPPAYRIRYRPRLAPAIELFTEASVDPTDLAPLMEGVSAGGVVTLGEGTYRGPVRVPDGVVLRGLGPARTRVIAPADASIATIVLGPRARLEHLAVGTDGVRDGAPHDTAGHPTGAVHMEGDDALLLGVTVRGGVRVAGSGAVIRGSDLDHVTAAEVDGLRVSRSVLSGSRSGTGVSIRGGAAHEVEGCEFSHHGCAIGLDGTQASTVRGNTIRADHCAIQLHDTGTTHVVGNTVTRTMRAVDVDGGSDIVIDGNAVSEGDSGCIVERGATEVTVSGNHWSRCRIGLLAWDAGEVHHRGNLVVDLRDRGAEVRIGPS